MLLPLPKVGGGGSWVDGPSRGGRQPNGISPPRGGSMLILPCTGETPELVPIDMGCVGGITYVGFSSCAGRDYYYTF